MPFDVAFALYDYELAAWGVIMSEFEGAGKFNWETMSWDKD